VDPAVRDIDEDHPDEVADNGKSSVCVVSVERWNRLGFFVHFVVKGHVNEGVDDYADGDGDDSIHLPPCGGSFSEGDRRIGGQRKLVGARVRLWDWHGNLGVGAGDI